MNNRKYNLFFHLHTISGISISVMLFVIFFAGAFTLFQGEITQWEQYGINKTKAAKDPNAKSFVKAWERVQQETKAPFGRTASFYKHDGELAVYMSPSADTTVAEKERTGGEYIYHETTDKLGPHEAYYGTGTLLYWLHFYWQFGQIGYLIAGFVSLFFFLAIVTGVLVHWKKIVTNFFTFRPFAKWKTIWTDAHTALGIIGLPFQFLYALTGSIFGLGLLLSSTVAISFFDSDVNKFYDEFYPSYETRGGQPLDKEIDLAHYIDLTHKKWPAMEVDYLKIVNIGSDSARVMINGQLPVKEEFLGDGMLIFDVATDKIVQMRDPYATNYQENSRNWIYRIHYANFGDIGTMGNILLKTAYFLMALLTCFVIITGVLIWLTAREKKGLPEKKRKWNRGVGYFYLGSCLSLFPVVAWTMIVSKCSSIHTEDYMNYVFFNQWLFVSIGLALLRDNQRIFRITLLWGGILSLCVPIVSGLAAGNWFWLTYGAGARGVFAVDVIFILLGLTALFTYQRVKVVQKRKLVKHS